MKYEMKYFFFVPCNVNNVLITNFSMFTFLNIAKKFFENFEFGRLWFKFSFFDRYLKI